MNPARDVAYAMGSYLDRAIMLLKHPNSWYMEKFFKEGGTVDELNALIESWNKYAEAVTGQADVEITTVRDAFMYAKFFDLKRETQLLGFAVLGMVVKSAYFSGYKDAVTAGGVGSDFNSPEDLKAFTCSSRSRVRRWIRSTLFWFLRKT